MDVSTGIMSGHPVEEEQMQQCEECDHTFFEYLCPFGHEDDYTEIMHNPHAEKKELEPQQKAAVINAVKDVTECLDKRFLFLLFAVCEIMVFYSPKKRADGTPPSEFDTILEKFRTLLAEELKKHKLNAFSNWGSRDEFRGGLRSGAEKLDKPSRFLLKQLCGYYLSHDYRHEDYCPLPKKLVSELIQIDSDWKILDDSKIFNGTITQEHGTHSKVSFLLDLLALDIIECSCPDALRHELQKKVDDQEKEIAELQKTIAQQEAVIDQLKRKAPEHEGAIETLQQGRESKRPETSRSSARNERAEIQRNNHN